MKLILSMILKAPRRHVINMAAYQLFMVYLRSGMWSLLIYCIYCHLKIGLSDDVDSCENLHLGQYPLIYF